MNKFRVMKKASLPLAISVLIALGHAAHAGQAAAAATQGKSEAVPLIDKVRAATARFRDINVALAEGFVQGTPCVSGPDTGAMGVHFVMGSRITGGVVLQPDEPQALIYEPQPDGAFRLVGVEFIVLAGNWLKTHDAATVPALDGDLMNFIDAPNRYGLPAFYELHVWAWENNPEGSFADWNTHVTCEKQPST